MSLDFVDLENAAIQHQRQEAQENLYMFGERSGTALLGNIRTCTNTRIYHTLSCNDNLFVSFFIWKPIYWSSYLDTHYPSLYCELVVWASPKLLSAKTISSWSIAKTQFGLIASFCFLAKNCIWIQKKAKDVRIIQSKSRLLKNAG